VADKKALISYKKPKEQKSLSVGNYKGHGIVKNNYGNKVCVSDKFIVKEINSKNAIVFLDKYSLEEVKTITADDMGMISHFNITKDSRYLYLSDYKYGASSIFRVWDLEKMLLTSEIEICIDYKWNQIFNYCVDENSEYAFIVHTNTRKTYIITEYNLKSCFKTGWEISFNKNITALEVAKEKKYIIIAVSDNENYKDDSLEVWDYENKKRVCSTNISSRILDITISEYENFAAVTTNTNQILLLDIEKGEVIFRDDIETGHSIQNTYINKGHSFMVAGNILINCKNNKVTKLSLKETMTLENIGFSQIQIECIYNEIKLDLIYKTNRKINNCSNLELYQVNNDNFLNVESKKNNDYMSVPLQINLYDLNIIKKDRPKKEQAKYLIDKEQSTIFVVGTETNKILFEQTGVFPYVCARLSENEKYMFVYDESKVLSRYDIEGTECVQIPIPLGISKRTYRQIIIDYYGRFALVCTEQELLLFDFSKKEQILKMTLPENFLCFDINYGKPLVCIHSSFNYMAYILDKSIIFMDFRGTDLCRVTLFDNGNKYIWQTPPDELAPNGWFYTNDPKNVFVYLNNGGKKEELLHGDQLHIEYFNTFNRKDMIVNRLNNMEKYKHSITSLLTQQETYEKYKRLKAEHKLIK
jgi:WD40 repeat protein